MRKRASFFGLRRGKLRQSWNKYNLYNLSRTRSPIGPSQTFFQQKWYAKAATRSYHGETVKEKHWKRLFSPTMRSVIPMNAKYLAENDGSEQSAGRGSGADIAPGRRKRASLAIPYMNMVYAPLERRLDTAIHRAMFASSTRQARQFVVHGYVKVNGKKMVYPGYQLNPGDMFQVEPDRVMFATGAPKDSQDRRESRKIRAQQRAGKTIEEEDAGSDAAATTTAIPEPLQSVENTTETLKAILDRSRELLATEKTSAGAKRKRALRELQRLVRKTISRGKVDDTTPLTDSVDAQMVTLMSQLNLAEEAAQPAAYQGPADSTAAAEAASGSPSSPGPDDRPRQTLSRAQKRDLERALQELRDNPVDPSKPYATPWRPRDWMSPFAFIPRYLEVHHRICSAVYLRHPVARPGIGEVPTPFGAEINGLAFNWYLRRR